MWLLCRVFVGLLQGLIGCMGCFCRVYLKGVGAELLGSRVSPEEEYRFVDNMPPGRSSRV